MTEIHWLAATCLMTALFWLPYILNAMAVRGIAAALSNPSPDDAPLAAWAQRAKAAHSNAIENLVVFAALALGIVALGLSSPATILATMIYFFTRLTHYVVYTAGIPVLRTLAFALGWLMQVFLALTILGIF